MQEEDVLEDLSFGGRCQDGEQDGGNAGEFHLEWMTLE